MYAHVYTFTYKPFSNLNTHQKSTQLDTAHVVNIYIFPVIKQLPTFRGPYIKEFHHPVSIITLLIRL